ncbi:hypothetical protein HMPREF9120_01346, partial [Neisseria sp. oral taxon 020 str. F0370]
WIFFVLFDYIAGCLHATKRFTITRWALCAAHSCAIKKQSRCIAALSGGIPIWPIRVSTWV